MPFERYFEARILGSCHGQTYINVLHFGSDEDAADNEALIALLVQLAGAILQCALAQLIPAASSDFTLLGVDAKQLHPIASDPNAVFAPAGSVGGRGTINASFETMVMRKKTGLAGKSKRGRNFLAPPGDADIVNGLLVAGTANDFYSGFLTCLRDKFIGANKTEPFTMGVMSRKVLKANPADFDNAFTPVQSLSLDQRLTHMHSRKLAVGG